MNPSNTSNVSPIQNNNNNTLPSDRHDSPVRDYHPSHLKSHRCRQTGKSHVPIQSVEEGVKVIDEILRKELLCRHDIDHLTQVYGEIKLLEHKVNLVSISDRKVRPSPKNH